MIDSMLFSITKEKSYYIYIVYFFIILFCQIAIYHDIFSVIENQILSFNYTLRQHYGNSEKNAFPANNIVLVTCDKSFYNNYNSYPFRRKDIARVINNLGLLGARVIAVDMFFKYKSSYEDDLLLKEAISKNKVICASQAEFFKNTIKQINYPIFKGYTGYANINSENTMSKFTSSFKIDPIAIKDFYEWPFPVKILSSYLNTKPKLNKKNELKISNLTIEFNKYNEIYIDYPKIPEQCNYLHEFSGISAFEFLDLSKLDSDEITELKYWIFDKIVIFGDTFDLSKDQFKTPVGIVYGSELIAYIINTLLKQAPIKRVPFYLELIICILFFYLLFFSLKLSKKPGIIVLLFILLILGHIFICSAAFIFKGIYIYFTYNLIFGIIALILIIIYLYILEIKKRNLVSKKYKDIYENCDFGIFQLDFQLNITDINPAFIKILGYENYEQFNKFGFSNLHSIFLSNEESLSIIERIKDIGSIQNHEVRLLNKEKRTIWVMLSIKPFLDKENIIQYYTGIIIDISQKKLNEQKIINQRIEKIINEKYMPELSTL